LRRPTDLKSHSRGFTLIEVLVTIVILAASLAAIGSLAASNVRATRAIDQRLALIETARSILTGLPDRDQLLAGGLSGDLADYRWRIDVRPFTDQDAGLPTAPWVPERVVINVRSPAGQSIQIDTIRLHRMEGNRR